MGKLDGKVALITGAARGMGAAHVRKFLTEGARVVFGDVLQEDGRSLAKELGHNCRFIEHDVTSAPRWEEVVSETVSEFGALDILVNNAGILRFGAMATTTVDDFRQILDVNLVSQWLGLKYASAVMPTGSAVVNISSLNGVRGGTNLSGYSASKFGVTGLTKSAALELGPQGIRVNSVHPGGVSTPMLGRTEDRVEDETTGPMARIPIPRYARAGEVSKLVLFLASDDSSYCTGAEFVIDGGMSAGAGF